MTFWCYNCQQPIQSVQQLKCELCSCEAIEEISQNNNPQNFQPYVPQHQAQPSGQSNQQSNQQNDQVDPRQRESMRDPLGLDLFGSMSGMSMISSFIQRVGDENGPVYIRYTVSRPVFGILFIDTEEEEKTPVDLQKINQLQQVPILKEDCAICQQKEGSGLKLPCNHEFHQNCIKPWFEQTNTCPCCRTVL